MRVALKGFIPVLPCRESKETNPAVEVKRAVLIGMFLAPGWLDIGGNWAHPEVPSVLELFMLTYELQYTVNV